MRINTSGWVFVILGAALIIAAYRFGFPGLLPLGILFIGLVLFSLCAALLTSTQLRAVLVADAPVVHETPVTRVGTELTVTARIFNSVFAPLLPFALTLHTRPGFGSDQEAHVGMLTPRGTADVRAVFVPTHRGMTGIERITAAVDGPFGLVSTVRTVPGALSVAVSPSEAPVGVPQSLSAHLSRVSTDRVSRGRGARDFFTREYAPGDDLRHIHWKTTARIGELAVRQEAEEEHATAIVVLDGGGATEPASDTQAARRRDRASGSAIQASDPVFETLAAGAAAAVRAYFAAGYDVRLLCGGDDIAVAALSTELAAAELALAQADGTSVPGSVRLPANVETVVVCRERSALGYKVPARARVWTAADAAAAESAIGKTGDAVLPQAWNFQSRRL